MKNKRRKIIYTALFFLGIILMIFEIEIFRNTIIDLIIPVVIIFTVGVIGFIVDFKNYKMTYEKRNILLLYFYGFMNYSMGLGFITCSIFMMSNYYFSNNYATKSKFEIINRSSLHGPKYHREQRSPTFTINYEGKIKELVFSNKFYKEMESFSKVELEIEKGYFGFDILKGKKLKK